MKQSRSRLMLFTVLTLLICLTAGLAGGAEAAKKKGKKKPSGNFATVTKTTGAAIPPFVAAPAVPLDTALDIGGKAFKGKLVGDVNITVQTTGNVAGAANDLIARLSAPNGRTVGLFTSVGGAQASIGPLTLDDDTRILACDAVAATTCTDTDPFATLVQPFAGRAAGFSDGAFVGLNRFNGVPMRGSWILSIWDTGGAGQTSTLTRATLEVRAAP